VHDHIVKLSPSQGPMKPKRDTRILGETRYGNFSYLRGAMIAVQPGKSAFCLLVSRTQVQESCTSRQFELELKPERSRAKRGDVEMLSTIGSDCFLFDRQTLDLKRLAPIVSPKKLCGTAVRGHFRASSRHSPNDFPFVVYERSCKLKMIAPLPELNLRPLWKHSGSKRGRFIGGLLRKRQRKDDPGRAVATTENAKG